MLISTEAQLRVFLEENETEIRDSYHSSTYRDGGWNGLLSAISMISEREGVEINIDEENEDDDTFINVVNEVFNN